MGLGNHSPVTEFLILGISEDPGMQVPVTALLLLIYLITVLSNSVVFSIICFEPRLHKPMYLFLLHMSFIDILLTSVTCPKAMAIHLSDKKIISFAACISQLYFFQLFAATEFLLLTAMAYDRYIAICNPLRYATIMSKKMCVQLATASWTFSLLVAVPQPLLMSKMSFCGHQTLNHFFCDVIVLTKLTCSDASGIIMFTFVIAVFLGIPASMMTLTSYVFIIVSILGIRSSTGRRQAFSTCSAHITAVLLYYGTAFCNYLTTKSFYNNGEEKIFSLIFAAVIPMLNPLIYTLRNKEVKKSLTYRGRMINKQCTWKAGACALLALLCPSC